MIDSIYEPVIVTDASGHVIKVNRAAVTYSAGRSAGNGGGPDLSLSGVIGRRAQSCKPFAMRRNAAAGRRRRRSCVVPIRAGRSRAQLSVAGDTDARLGWSSDRGSHMLEDITAITEVDKLKTEFISVASAKLREPLRSLQLALHAVIEGHTGELNEQQIGMLESATEDAAKLDELMNDLLELSEIESGTRRYRSSVLRPIDLARAAVERFRSAAEARTSSSKTRFGRTCRGCLATARRSRTSLTTCYPTRYDTPIAMAASD